MNMDQVRKVAIERTEIEYLFENNQWLPAIISLQVGSNHAPYITVHLLKYPANHSGVVSLDEEDIQYRLRIKSSH